MLDTCERLEESLKFSSLHHLKLMNPRSGIPKPSNTHLLSRFLRNLSVLEFYLSTNVMHSRYSKNPVKLFLEKSVLTRRK